jgi:HD-GYP domain-containing protein (c-di-GMP phosphodiesterase class II)/DNA-binding CsgD family transcriptional regulator
MSEPVRLAELTAALSLATDVGMGQPLEQAVRTCLIALQLGERAGLSGPERSDVYYVALLRFLGCTADAHDTARLTGGDEIAFRAAVAPVLGGRPRELAARMVPVIGRGRGRVDRARLVAGMLTAGKQRLGEGLRAHCEVAESLAARLGLTSGVRKALGAAFEQWNGRGLPNGTAGGAIPVAARIVFLARDMELLHRAGGTDALVTAVRDRRGTAYDPALADAVLDQPARLLAALDTTSPWQEVLAQEPRPHLSVPADRVDEVLSVFADYSDLKSPYTVGHSRGVAELASASASNDPVTLHRAGLVHDLGRGAVPNGIWDKPGPLTDGEWERVRLHAYYTERILERVPALRPLARLAGLHHERLDASGYHRGCSPAEVPAPARVLAAADAYQAMTQPRPHRPPLDADAAARQLQSMARSGSLDPDAVYAVVTAADHRPSLPRPIWPAGLTDREVEVLRLICRGATKKHVAGLLSISPSTVDHHVRHIYEKAGVHTRAGATLFALAHHLLRQQ